MAKGRLEAEFLASLSGGEIRRFRQCRMAKKRARKTYRRIFLKQWREYRGLSQERLAERIGRSVGQISQLERGLIGYTQETLELLADALLCDPADLIMRNPQDPEAIWSLWENL